MSDYPNVDAFVQGRTAKVLTGWPQLHIEVTAMQKQLEAQKKEIERLRAMETDRAHRKIAFSGKYVKASGATTLSYTRLLADAGDAAIENEILQDKVSQLREQLVAQKKRIASLIKALAEAPYPHQLSQLREQLKKEKEKMSGYPNIDAVIEGRVSGSPSEWPQLRHEVMGVMKQLEALRKQLRVHDDTAKFEIRLLDAQLSDKDNQIKELKQLLNNQASTIANLQRSVREGCFADDEKIEQLEEKRKTMVATRDEVIANKDEEIEELKRRNANQVFNCRSLREGKIRLREEIKQLSAELVETQKDVSFLCVKELCEKIKQLRRQRDCLHKYFSIGLYVKMPDDLVEVLFEIDEED